EQHHVLVEWNATEEGYLLDLCLHQLIEAQTARTPDALAVIFEDRQLSYRQLNERANQLAHFLRSASVGPGAMVGICLERSVEMIVGLLAILKAGTAYLPLDPTYPQDRLAFMLEDGQISLLVTASRLARLLPQHRAAVINLDEDWPA